VKTTNVTRISNQSGENTEQQINTHQSKTFKAEEIKLVLFLIYARLTFVYLYPNKFLAKLQTNW
jgi:hypothetical protein